MLPFPATTIMAWWIWILIGFALLAMELTTSTLHVGFFAIGALVVAALVGFGVEMPLWGELLIFTGVSVFLMSSSCCAGSKCFLISATTF